MGEIRDIFNDSSKKLAILIDPDKIRNSEDIATLTDKINFLNPTFIFVGGSTVDEADFDRCIVEIKQRTQIPVIIFPGSYQQISEITGLTTTNIGFILSNSLKKIREGLEDYLGEGKEAKNG